MLGRDNNLKTDNERRIATIYHMSSAIGMLEGTKVTSIDVSVFLFWKTIYLECR